MRILRNKILVATLWLFLCAVFLPAQEVSQTGKDLDRLTEEREKRANESQPPQLIMDILGIRPGLIIGEVGAGRGRVTVHMADRVGEQGRIYANDIDDKSLEYLEERCQRLGLSNVEIVHGLVDDARFPSNTLDLAFMAGVYNHLENPVRLLKNLMPNLKPWGVVVMVEPMAANPREKISREASEAGFLLEAVIEGPLKSSGIFLLRPIVPDSPESHDPQKVRALWLDYLEWAKTVQVGSSPRDYAVSLDAQGLPGPEVRRRLHVLRSQFTEQPEGIEMIYDPLYGKPLTGDMDKDGFKTAPNSFLVEAMSGIAPAGQALDVGAGMGRNAIHLAGLGWEVTGIDLSAEGLAVMRASAEKAGLRVETIKTSYLDYDFGRERWNLVAMILSWAPVEEDGFLSRLKESICPGGYVVFEHVLQRKDNPFPSGVHALAPGELRELFSDFEILIYREVEDYGDWGGAPTPHVRMVARKRPTV
jgi:ubiquinone/menaquinone biosynthesis C-methylase UbiE